jgi:hypothetical protein
LRSRGTSIEAAAGVAFSGRGRLFCLNRLRLKRAYPPAGSPGGWYRSPPGRRGAFTASLLAWGDGR